MDNGNPEFVRMVSVTINVRVNSISQADAQKIEDEIRDIADNYEGVEVIATRGNERPSNLR
jgi:hypothetical protein